MLTISSPANSRSSSLFSFSVDKLDELETKHYKLQSTIEQKDAKMRDLEDK